MQLLSITAARVAFFINYSSEIKREDIQHTSLQEIISMVVAESLLSVFDLPSDNENMLEEFQQLQEIESSEDFLKAFIKWVTSEHFTFLLMQIKGKELVHAPSQEILNWGLGFAVTYGCRSIPYWLDAGAQLNQPVRSYTPLIAATAHGSLAASVMLIQYGADLSFTRRTDYVDRKLLNIPEAQTFDALRYIKILFPQETDLIKLIEDTLKKQEEDSQSCVIVSQIECIEDLSVQQWESPQSCAVSPKEMDLIELMKDTPAKQQERPRSHTI